MRRRSWTSGIARNLLPPSQGRKQRDVAGETKNREVGKPDLPVRKNRNGLRQIPIGRVDDAAIVVVDLERPAIHVHIYEVLFRRVTGYSPRVRTGETSAILEVAGGNFGTIFRGNRKCRFVRPATINDQVTAVLAGGANQ
jgi:hypothetical protein